jgi:hypothetical protein
MKNRKLMWVIVSAVSIFFVGCVAETPRYTGFLSDYSKLESQSNTSFRYLDMTELGKYSKFIIEPVEMRLYKSSEASSSLSQEDRTDIKSYMHAALVKALEGGPYEIVYRPGPGVARVRVAITDLKKSEIIQNTMPLTKLAGTGLGGASLEAELVDSQTHKQIGAVVESQVGDRLSLDGYATWGDAKAIMDGWAERFRARLDESRSK